MAKVIWKITRWVDDSVSLTADFRQLYNPIDGYTTVVMRLPPVVGTYYKEHKIRKEYEDISNNQSGLADSSRFGSLQ